MRQAIQVRCSEIGTVDTKSTIAEIAEKYRRVRGEVQVELLALFRGVIPNSAQFSRVRDLAWEPPWMRCRFARDPSLRLKNGCGQDDAIGY
jgi:hypothetical protein